MMLSPAACVAQTEKMRRRGVEKEAISTRVWHIWLECSWSQLQCLLSCVTLACEEPYTVVGLFINQILEFVSHTQLVSDHGWNTNDIH